ncbi:unnamed protein product [Acanthosepion pharaonis]|uniref:Uncharacterized protein n=1 Tax=Acanthosepion pharaonis TaxID=158019 RepID=A0A812D5G4_ACAPH|nr:unnamed protein product [Sepia pharaonis]
MTSADLSSLSVCENIRLSSFAQYHALLFLSVKYHYSSTFSINDFKKKIPSSYSFFSSSLFSFHIYFFFMLFFSMDFDLFQSLLNFSFFLYLLPFFFHLISQSYPPFLPKFILFFSSSTHFFLSFYLFIDHIYISIQILLFSFPPYSFFPLLIHFSFLLISQSYPPFHLNIILSSSFILLLSSTHSFSFLTLFFAFPPFSFFFLPSLTLFCFFFIMVLFKNFFLTIYFSAYFKNYFAAKKIPHILDVSKFMRI